MSSKLPATIPSTTTTVNGVVLTVWKKTFGMYLSYLEMIEESRVYPEGEEPAYESESTADRARRGFHENVYPALAACTSAEKAGTSVPTEVECQSILQEELESWIEAVQLMNPKLLGPRTPSGDVSKKE